MVTETFRSGRNVCRYYLMGVCKFGETCNYSHSKEFLLQNGWWSTAKELDTAKKIYEVQQKFKQAAIDYEKNNKSSSNSGPKKKRSKGKKKSAHPQSKVNVVAGGNWSVRTEPGQPSRSTTSNLWPKYAHLSPDDDESDDQDEEYGIFGFTNSEVEELVCHGIKPWGDYVEARVSLLVVDECNQFAQVFYCKNFLDALHEKYRKIDAL